MAAASRPVTPGQNGDPRAWQRRPVTRRSAFPTRSRSAEESPLNRHRRPLPQTGLAMHRRNRVHRLCASNDWHLRHLRAGDQLHEGRRLRDHLLDPKDPMGSRSPGGTYFQLDAMKERSLEHPEFRAHPVSCVQLRRVAAAVVRLPGLPPSRVYVA